MTTPRESNQERCDVCGHIYDADTEGACLDDGQPPYHFCDACRDGPEAIAKRRREEMKIPTFFLDADDDMGNRAIGLASNRAVAEANLLAEIQGALDRLTNGNDGDRLTLMLTRRDMTSEELDALPEV